MDQKTFDLGLGIRKDVIGKEFVEKALNEADDFTRPLQELVTQYCWGECWGREGLSRKTRSMLNAGIPAGVDSFRIAHEVIKANTK
jgi:4-carboxymuconolactone decarboxylase